MNILSQIYHLLGWWAPPVALVLSFLITWFILDILKVIKDR